MSTVSDSPPLGEPRLLIDVPPGFAGLPIGGDAEQIAQGVRGLSARVAHEVPESPAEIGQCLESLAQVLVERNVRLYGRFAVSADDLPEPVLADLALAMPSLSARRVDPGFPGENREAVARRLVEQYRQRHPDADAHFVRLTSGPAMVAQRAGHFRVPVAGKPHDVVVPQFKAEFQLPAPSSAHLVVMTVTTSSEPGWPAVAAAAVRIADSIRFEYPPADPLD